jgi:hypothetical protein
MVALLPSSLLHERLGEVLVADTNSGRPDGMAEERYTPSAEARNLGDEPTDVQALEKAGDARTLPRVCMAAGGKETVSQFAVTQAEDRVFAAQDGLKDSQIISGGGVEAAQ